jgi:N-acetylneuraminic acid mutarotase
LTKTLFTTEQSCIKWVNMRNSLALLLVLVLAASCLIAVKPSFSSTSTADAENTWVKRAPMPTPRSHLLVAAVNGKIYAIGGGGPIGTNEEYAPALDNWTEKTSMPSPKQSFAIATFNGKIYCIGGLGEVVSADNKVYDPANDSWENKASMPTARYGLLANTIDGKIYCMGGVKLLGYNQGYQELNNNEVYDPSNDTWTTKAPMPNSAGYASAVVDNKIYVIGSGAIQIYSPETDSWSTGALPLVNITLGANGQSSSAAASTGFMAPKRIYVYDGASLQIYNPQNDSWAFGAAPPTNRQYLGIVNVNDTFYFIGGLTDDPSGLPWYSMPLNTNEQYTPIGYGTLPEQEPFPIVPVAIISIVVSATVVAGLLFYFKKRKH